MFAYFSSPSVRSRSTALRRLALLAALSLSVAGCTMMGTRPDEAAPRVLATAAALVAAPADALAATAAAATPVPVRAPTPIATAYAPLSARDTDPHSGVARARRMQVHGIDVSRWQGEIDWDAVRGAGIRFAFLKTTEGSDHVDPRFMENWNGAARAGIPRGAYHFMYWCRPIHQQALFFVLNVPADPGALPPVLDVEWNNESESCRRDVPPAEARAMMQVMLDAMEAHTGKRPVIYTDINFHRDVLRGGQFAGYKFWLRSVAADPREVYDDRPWAFWQFTATGRVPGIRENVDRNVFNGSVADWERWMRAAGVGAAAGY